MHQGRIRRTLVLAKKQSSETTRKKSIRLDQVRQLAATLASISQRLESLASEMERNGAEAVDVTHREMAGRGVDSLDNMLISAERQFRPNPLADRS